MKYKVVIIGHSYTSRLSIIRSIAEIGCEIVVIVMTGYKKNGKTINSKKPVDCFSKYVSHFYFCARNDGDGLIQLLLNRCTDPLKKVILIPDSDYTVATIDNNQELLKEFFLFPHIHHQPGAILYWMDKSNQKELAREVGLNVANATIIEIKDGSYTIPTDIEYPCFSKPLATMIGGKGGMQRCNNATELSNALNNIIQYRSKNAKVLIEDYKEIGQEYALLGFSDGNEVTIPGILQFIETSIQHKGIARQGIVKPIDGFELLIEKFRQLIIHIGFIGIFDIDFFESKGVYYFCEINFRFGGSGYAITKMGVNLPTMMVKSLSGENVINEMQKTISGKAIYVNDNMCLEDWNYGHISLRQYHQLMETATISFISDLNDPTPQLIFERNFKKRKIIKLIKRFLPLSC